MTIPTISGNAVRSLIGIAAFWPALLCAQLGQTTVSSITVTATQAAAVQPADAVFLVTVNSPVSASLSDAAASLSSVGITAANLLTVGSVQSNTTTSTQPSAALAWTFQLISPFANQKATASALAALGNSIAQNNSGLALSFSVQSYGESAAACDLAGLVTNARSQAQILAVAAGKPLGAIVGITGAVSNASPAACSMTVSFALGYQYLESAPAITINASQAGAAQPNQATVAVSVNSGLSAGLEDVTNALQTAGIGGTTLITMNSVTTYTVVGNQSQPVTSIMWLFELTTPIANLNALLGQLAAAQPAFQKQNPTLSLAFSVAGVSASPPAACQEPALLAMAQAQAQLVAAAAGAHAGPVLNLATNSSAAVVNRVNIGSQGSFGGTSTSTGSIVTIGLGPSTVCTMNAQFQLE